MRQLLLLFLTIVLLDVSPARADDQADAAKIVEAGLKAIGGREKVAKYKASTWNEQGTYYGMGAGLPYTGVYSVQWPDQFRMEIAGVFVIVLNGDKGWTKMADQVTEMTAEQLAEQRENHHAGWVTTLVPLADKTYKLSTMGESTVAGKPALGVNVKREGHRDVQLYFDKEKSWLVKSEVTVKAAELNNKEVHQESLYQDYRDVEGILAPAKIELKRDGAKFVEAENSQLKHLEMLDNSVFAKP